MAGKHVAPQSPEAARAEAYARFQAAQAHLKRAERRGENAHVIALSRNEARREYHAALAEASKLAEVAS